MSTSWCRTALSLHRLVGVELGLQPDPITLTPETSRRATSATTPSESLLADLGRAGLEPLHWEGIFLKVLSNRQMLDWDWELIEAIAPCGAALPRARGRALRGGRRGMTTVLLLGAGGSAAGERLRRAEVGPIARPPRSSAPTPIPATSTCRGSRRSASSCTTVADLAVSRRGRRHGARVTAVTSSTPNPIPTCSRSAGCATNIAAAFLPDQAVLELAADKLGLAVRDDRGGRADTGKVDVSTPRRRRRTTERAAWCATNGVWVRARVELVHARRFRSGPVVRRVHGSTGGCDEHAMCRCPTSWPSEMLPGREFAYQSVWQDGELVAGQARERIGVPVRTSSHRAGRRRRPRIAVHGLQPVVDAMAQQAIRALDSVSRTGCSAWTSRSRPAGVGMVTEINAGRFFTTSNFFAAAGLNMPDLAMRCAIGERPPRASVVAPPARPVLDPHGRHGLRPRTR